MEREMGVDLTFSHVRRLLVVMAMVTATLGLAGQADAATWAPADSATIHPGVQTVTGGGQCTANFVFTAGSDILIGQAAHCSGLGGATATNGCETGSLDLQTPVEIQGADHPGTLVYSSWLTMQAAGETDPNICAYNDFALVRIDPRDHDKVNPSLPVWGGPAGTDTNGSSAGETVFTYGNSSLRLGLTPLSPKTGLSLGTSGGGWTTTMLTVTPGIPGDSGSAVLSQDGQALGILVTVAIAPVPASNGVTNLDLALAYANQFGGAGATLASGTEAFTGLGGLTGILS
jgi:hypothetical protein